ncbi:hypothetical protein O7635_26305 [Asanoa sp. WMMD1127]|uniref:hypothetical protein n=1 Tax=Asanoa sp. WMMD1127 TaxID=3016107 RepID=UPI002417F24F|nr:hypothetical protein [Asanoa sp. WMMD1127]MDG4825374.1 hypothetical protein [Asanoa sp. WMMD1127]
MDVAVVRFTLRSVVGLVGVALVLAVAVRWSPRADHAAVAAWRPPVGYALAETVPLSGDRALRLWTGPNGWQVESLVAGRSESAVGAAGGVDQFAVSEVLGGFVGTVPTRGCRAALIRDAGGIAVRADLHDGFFLVAAEAFAATGDALLVTPLDAAGRPLAGETVTPIAGRP